MDQSQLRRLGGAAGILFTILFLIAFFISGDPPGFNASPEQLADYFADNRGELQVTTALLIAAGPLFLLFLAALARVLRIGEGRGPATLSAAAYAGGLIFAALILLAVGLLWATSYHGGLEAGAMQGLYDASNGSFLLAFGIGLTTLVGATAAVGLATGTLGRWLSVFGVVLAAYTLVVAIIASFSETGAFNPIDGDLTGIAVLAFLVWTVWTSIVLIAHAEGEPVGSIG